MTYTMTKPGVYAGECTCDTEDTSALDGALLHDTKTRQAISTYTIQGMSCVLG
ncbi:MAG: hypothetical protein K2X98_03340 [Alphaproteobacteria bacterium]|nr:hypothetical protein [Alphaproteobacteria bacterium]